MTTRLRACLILPLAMALAALACGGDVEPAAESPASPDSRPAAPAGSTSDTANSADTAPDVEAQAPEVDEPPFNPLGWPDWFTARSRFSHARLETVVDEDGTLHGVRVLSVHEGLRPANLTLQPGDLLLRINGLSLTDPIHKDRVQEIVAWAFLRADQINVRLLRDGEEFSLVEMAPVRPEPAAGP